MKKLLLILLCVPLIFSSCGDDNKNTSLDININELEDPCDFINALLEVSQDIYNLGEENKWEPLSEGSQELNQAKDFWKKFIEIRSAGWEYLGPMTESEQEECGVDINNMEDQREKIGDWIQTFQEYLE
jgi:hypothetical protein